MRYSLTLDNQTNVLRWIAAEIRVDRFDAQAATVVGDIRTQEEREADFHVDQKSALDAVENAITALRAYLRR